VRKALISRVKIEVSIKRIIKYTPLTYRCQQISHFRWDLVYLVNEPVGKVLLTSENDVFGGHLTLPKYEIVDCGAFCEVIFFYI
jgi:hypothetical protein